MATQKKITNFDKSFSKCTDMIAVIIQSNKIVLNNVNTEKKITKKLLGQPSGYLSGVTWAVTRSGGRAGCSPSPGDPSLFLSV